MAPLEFDAGRSVAFSSFNPLPGDSVYWMNILVGCVVCILAHLSLVTSQNARVHVLKNEPATPNFISHPQESYSPRTGNSSNKNPTSFVGKWNCKTPHK